MKKTMKLTGQVLIVVLSYLMLTANTAAAAKNARAAVVAQNQGTGNTQGPGTNTTGTTGTNTTNTNTGSSNTGINTGTTGTPGTSTGTVNTNMGQTGPGTTGTGPNGNMGNTDTLTNGALNTNGSTSTQAPNSPVNLPLCRVIPNPGNELGYTVVYNYAGMNRNDVRYNFDTETEAQNKANELVAAGYCR